jgi:hypothetical protein
VRSNAALGLSGADMSCRIASLLIVLLLLSLHLSEIEGRTKKGKRRGQTTTPDGAEDTITYSSEAELNVKLKEEYAKRSKAANVGDPDAPSVEELSALKSEESKLRKGQKIA